ncbi:AraC family transcriptional regulator [Stenotrophomonas maltophilia]|uniref:AraC family transcriptional regulator n=1 Tax=Stenotrophomonas TaxID=40323 RepID=UPI00109DFC80|nr:AraC family transcriptional regulator [Stenotrophomonas sp. PAMC25021]MBH1513294.1 AraC family transcriptional regulator [Stenotrophomonas maltophilia]MBH1547342.1 AraC family transcriptional regulator [Stenotrophomonas maltophilia]MBH1860121.1 AraC family transcriptional regulator [Stenotrophomonas maltophilia]MBN5062582.1 AraC family transcriptional regulator [Stenotrophomonas maltophilia]MCU1032988.1 AraC family transcriptional regulator [Stenotrophomonas maltophilia]
MVDSLQRQVQARMVGLLKTLAVEEGYTLTRLPGVRLLRSDRPLARTPVLYDPGIVIVCQGVKRGYLGGQVYQYDAQHYLAVSVPVPFTMETDASAQAPLLAIYLHLDLQLAADLLIELGEQEGTPATPAQSMMSSPMQAPMQATVLRLLEALAEPLEAAVLGPALVREVYFRVLTGAQGGAMREALAMRGRFGSIGRVLRTIHAGYATTLDVGQLATEAGMSVATFHDYFRAITGTSPKQYVKSTRLHQARLLMLRQGMTAEAASLAVGYASPSQFNREFKRLFALPPAAEVARMRRSFALPPPPADAVYVSSH